MNFLAAVKTANFAERLFAAAGLDLSAMLKAEDDTALAAHLESVRVAAAKPAAPVALTPDHPEVAALIATAVSSAQEPLQATIREHGLRLTAINGAIAAAGIQLADTAAPSEIGTSLAAALKAHASKEARALLAAKGFGSVALDAAPNPDPTKPPAPKASDNLTGLERAIAAHKAQIGAV